MLVLTFFLVRILKIGNFRFPSVPPFGIPIIWAIIVGRTVFIEAYTFPSSVFIEVIILFCFYRGEHPHPLSANTLGITYVSACGQFRRRLLLTPLVSIDLISLVRILKIGNFRFPSVPPLWDTNMSGHKCRNNCAFTYASHGLYFHIFRLLFNHHR